MNLLERWDRRNQRIVERANRREVERGDETTGGTAETGAQGFADLATALPGPFAIIAIVVAVVLAFAGLISRRRV